MDEPAPHETPPTVYHILIRDQLDQLWSEWLNGMSITNESDGTSTLSGPITDQAALHGLLAKIRDLGMTLLEVRQAAMPRPAAGDGDEADGDRNNQAGPAGYGLT